MVLPAPILNGRKEKRKEKGSLIKRVGRGKDCARSFYNRNQVLKGRGKGKGYVRGLLTFQKAVFNSILGANGREAVCSFQGVSSP